MGNRGYRGFNDHETQPTEITEGKELEFTIKSYLGLGRWEIEFKQKLYHQITSHTGIEEFENKIWHMYFSYLNQQSKGRSREFEVCKAKSTSVVKVIGCA